jgi:predicted Zn finger-like uncharacterized protein
MIVRCPDCRAEYEVDVAKDVEPGTRVRCPRCRAVFPVFPTASAPSPPERPSRPRVTDPALARRMARAMVSELVLNRQQERDRALGAGTALSSFGAAVTAAYRMYGEKVAPEMPGGKRIFREAVNEILGEGRPLL